MKKTISIILTFVLTMLLLLSLSGCSDKEVVDVAEIKYGRFPDSPNKTISGIASYYDYTIGDWSSIGHRVCAVRDFPRYSMVRATNVANGKSVICKVTDYGPDASVFPERVIDLSSTAFSDIAEKKLGIADVTIELISIK